MSKYYGLGSDGEWEIEEIAEYLNVNESTVQKYIHESELGEQAREMFPAAEARMQMDILMNLRERLEQVREIRNDLMKKKEVVPSSYKLESGTGSLNFENVEGVSRSGGEESPDNRITLETPVVDKYAEVTSFDQELQAVLREERKIEEEIREFLSLDEPDEVKTSHEGDAIVEQKIYTSTGLGDDLPETEIVDVDAEVVDAEGDVDE